MSARSVERLGPQRRVVGAELDRLVQRSARRAWRRLRATATVELGDQQQGLRLFRIEGDSLLQVGQGQLAVLLPVLIRAARAEDRRRRGRAALNQRRSQQPLGVGTVVLVEPFLQRALGQPDDFGQVAERIGAHFQLGRLVQIGLSFVFGPGRGGQQRAGQTQRGDQNTKQTSHGRQLPDVKNGNLGIISHRRGRGQGPGRKAEGGGRKGEGGGRHGRPEPRGHRGHPRPSG